MPPRPGTCRRLVVEGLLEPGELRTLRESCRRLQIPPETWPDVPSIEAFWTTLAAGRMIANLLEAEGISTERARTRAAVHLGIDPKTLESRIRRARESTSLRSVHAGEVATR